RASASSSRPSAASRSANPAAARWARTHVITGHGSVSESSQAITKRGRARASSSAARASGGSSHASSSPRIASHSARGGGPSSTLDRSALGGSGSKEDASRRAITVQPFSLAGGSGGRSRSSSNAGG